MKYEISWCLIPITRINVDLNEILLENEKFIEKCYDLIINNEKYEIKDNLLILFGNFFVEQNETYKTKLLRAYQCKSTQQNQYSRDKLELSENGVFNAITNYSNTFIQILVRIFNHNKFFLCPKYFKESVIFCLDKILTYFEAIATNENKNEINGV